MKKIIKNDIIIIYKTSNIGLGNMSINTIYGPMFAGKTTEFIKLAEKCPSEKCYIIKPGIDTRYSHDAIVSHNGRRIDNVHCVKDLIFELIAQEIDCSVDTFFIDEGHMFGQELVPFCVNAKNKGYDVYVAGVEKVFDGSFFDNMNELIEIADTKIYLQGKCGVTGCEEMSEYSYLKKKEKTCDGILVGGAELYAPICDFHFKNNESLTFDSQYN